MKLKVMAGAAALAAIGLGGPASAAERSWMVENFDRLLAAGPHDVTVVTGKAQRVMAEGDEEDLERLDIRVRNGTLRIGQKDSGGWFGSRSGPVKIYVTVPSLRAVSLAGSGDLNVNRVKGNEVALKLAGSGDLFVEQVEARELEVSLAGSGDVVLSGQCDTASLAIAGSGDINGAKLSCKTLDGSVAGSGNIAARASGTASVSVMGSGNVDITGGARCTVSTRGSGEVNCG